MQKSHSNRAPGHAKRQARGQMRVRAYPLFHRAVEEGVAYGWRRAHKHTDAPDAETVKDQIMAAVLDEVCQYFAFDDEEESPP